MSILKGRPLRPVKNNNHIQIKYKNIVLKGMYTLYCVSLTFMQRISYPIYEYLSVVFFNRIWVFMHTVHIVKVRQQVVMILLQTNCMSDKVPSSVVFMKRVTRCAKDERCAPSSWQSNSIPGEIFMNCMCWLCRCRKTMLWETWATNRRHQRWTSSNQNHVYLGSNGQKRRIRVRDDKMCIHYR